MLSGPRTCYRTSAQKTRRVLVRGSGSTMNRHTHIAATKTRRAENEGRGRHTHTTDTLRARCDGRRERKRTARAQLNLNATARTGQGPRTRHRLRLAGAVPFPLLTGGSVAPLSTAALLSTLEIGLGPSAARPLRRGAGRPIPNTISSGGGLAEGNGSAFNWLSRARRAPSDFPSPVAPPPSCELVATRGAETRERRPEPGLPSQVRNWSRGVPAPG